MGSSLPFMTARQFHKGLLRFAPGCSDSCRSRLYAHYGELCKWNPRLSLIGPGTSQDVLRRHYGESLAALPLIPRSARSILDVGTGGGFPGLVLAAARPGLRVTLIEPRERKWAFLKTATRRCGLSCDCLNVRVECPLPREIPRDIDIVTCRAIAISPALLKVLGKASPRARFLLWCGVNQPELPKGYRLESELPLAGSRARRILEIRPS